MAARFIFAHLRATFIPVLALSMCFGISNIAQAAAAADRWIGTWATAPFAAPNTKDPIGGTDVTLRQIVHVSLGGSRVRIVLSNEFGTGPLTIGAAHVALSAGAAEIKLASANALTFSGRSSITIPPGAIVVSDPTNLKLAPLSNLAVSLFLPAQTIHTLSQHGGGLQTNYSASGNAVGEKTFTNAKQFTSWEFLKGVDVLPDTSSGASLSHGAIVAFGDSITDGTHSTANANSRWPDELARRLQADKKLAGLSVLNEGIGGNRVLHDGTGPSALARFDRDVLSQAGVKYLIVMESINDIGHSTDPRNTYDVVTTADLIAGLQQLVERAHVHGIKVIGATLTPYVGAGYQSPAGEVMRTAVNDWIRSSKLLDGVIDFDMATRDTADPSKFSHTADSGDHLHPSDAGYKAMGDAIDLKLFSTK